MMLLAWLVDVETLAKHKHNVFIVAECMNDAQLTWNINVVGVMNLWLF